MTLIPPTSSKPGSLLCGSNQQNQYGKNMLGRRGWGIMNMKKKGLLVLEEWGPGGQDTCVLSKESGSPSHEHPPPFFSYTISSVLSNLKAC